MFVRIAILEKKTIKKKKNLLKNIVLKTYCLQKFKLNATLPLKDNIFKKCFWEYRILLTLFLSKKIRFFSGIQIIFNFCLQNIKKKIQLLRNVFGNKAYSIFNFILKLENQKKTAVKKIQFINLFMNDSFRLLF